MDYDPDNSQATARIARSYGAKVINVDRKGTGYARHSGVLSKGEHIMLHADADAVPHSDYIARAISLSCRERLWSHLATS